MVFYLRYIANLKYVGNSFLKSQGYSKSVYFDPTRPTDSFILITDAVFKRHFGLKVNSGKYVKPAVSYIQVRYHSSTDYSYFMTLAKRPL